MNEVPDKNIVFAKSVNGKITLFVRFGDGRILLRRSSPKVQLISTGAFMRVSALEMLETDASYRLGEKITQEKEINKEPDVILLFPDVRSIDAMINILLDCRSHLTKESSENSETLGFVD